MRWGAAVAAVAAGLAATASAQAADPSLILAERYAPVVRLVEQEEPCHHGEPFVPTNVNVVLASPDVAFRGPWDRTNIIKIAPTGEDLGKGLFDYHLDFPGNAGAPGCVYDEWSHRLNEGQAPTAYARVVTEPTYPGQLALQYWFFYVFNDSNDKHQGDWEMVQLDFDAATARQALRQKPALVGYSQPREPKARAGETRSSSSSTERTRSSTPRSARTPTTTPRASTSAEAPPRASAATTPPARRPSCAPRSR